MMRRRFSLLLALALVAAPFAARAADAPATPAPSPNAAEATFLAKVMSDLPKLFPTPQSALAAGYVRYTNEDKTGAISYAKPDGFNSTNVDQPAQLWYDVSGHLIGADYSVLQSTVRGSGVPALFGLDKSRFIRIPAHVHYVTCDAAGMCAYGKAMRASAYVAANGADAVAHPTPAGLVAAHAVPDAARVKTVFLYPGIYDVPVWVVANPLGQFAESNPNVHPSPNAGKGEDSM